jgi:hypothetical protein
MAWHDSDWKGAIFANPEANSYCVGTYSLPRILSVSVVGLTPLVVA